MPTFEIGAYCHQLEEANPIGVDHLTCLEADLEQLKSFKKNYPGVQLSIALDKKGLKTVKQWRGTEVTILAHHGMALNQECRSLLEQRFQVRVAIPASTELLKSMHLGSLDVIFDLMAYDFAKPMAGYPTSFHSSLHQIDQTLIFLHDHGVPLKKVNLGLSSSGILFKNVEPGMTTGYGQSALGEQLENPQIDVAAYLENHASAKTYYTSFLGCFQSFIYNSENGDWISYDDFKTFQSKIEWARHRGLRGVFLAPS